jgi:hypothetical protein
MLTNPSPPDPPLPNPPTSIPQVRFIEDIDEFAASFKPAASVELLIGAFSDLFSKFKAYETNLANKRINFLQKIPEIEKTLNLVKHLKAKSDEGETITTQYTLCDTIYAKAELTDLGTVNLWLGANVMLQYTYEEALELLTKRYADAKVRRIGRVYGLRFGGRGAFGLC